jgi:hypothetical protein
MKRLVLSFFLVTTVSCQAVLIGHFPGLEQLIEKADAIVVLRVEQNISQGRSDNLYSTHRCYIYQTLKGEIVPNSRVVLQLMDTRSEFVPPFVPSSTHLVFLIKKQDPREETDYRTIPIIGAAVRLSPFGNEKLPEGATTADKIRSLVKTAKAYGASEFKKENDFWDLISRPIPVLAPPNR